MRKLMIGSYVLSCGFFVLLILLILLAPDFVFAQAEDPPVGGVWDTLTTIYLIVASPFLAGIGWVLNLVRRLIDTKVKNQMLSGFLQRLVGSVNDVVAMLNNTAKKKIKEAKSPTSRGGSKLTQSEAKELKQAAWDAILSEYGGWDGLFRLFKKVGLGSEEAAKAKVDTMIEAAVARQKLEGVGSPT